MRSPQSVAHLCDADWNEIVELGRKSQLLGQLAARLHDAKVMDGVPASVRRHLELARLTTQRRSESAQWEIATLRRAIRPSIPLVLLKGCAYLACADDNAAGRFFSDIDILVWRENLSEVESDLVSVGWKPSRVNDYDQGYYRNWMHEVPPMEHVRRHTVLDLHHAINPPVSRFYINPDRLFERMIEVQPGVYVLAAIDRVIHCALHLLQEGEPKKLLRDLYDLHRLLGQHHGSDDGMQKLRHRGHELGVAASLETAVGAAQTLFAEVPKQKIRTAWLHACIELAACEANGRPTWRGELAGIVVLAHSHWMKMPLRLLLPHLVRKSVMRMKSKEYN